MTGDVAPFPSLGATTTTLPLDDRMLDGWWLCLVFAVFMPFTGILGVRALRGWRITPFVVAVLPFIGQWLIGFGVGWWLQTSLDGVRDLKSQLAMTVSLDTFAFVSAFWASASFGWVYCTRDERLREWLCRMFGTMGDTLLRNWRYSILAGELLIVYLVVLRGLSVYLMV